MIKQDEGNDVVDEKVLFLAVAMGYGLIEAIKALAGVIRSRTNGGHERIKEDSRIIRIEQKIDSIYDDLNSKDVNGLPLWMVPRAWGGMLEEMLQLQREVIELQKKIVFCLEDEKPKKKRGRPKKGA